MDINAYYFSADFERNKNNLLTRGIKIEKINLANEKFKKIKFFNEKLNSLRGEKNKIDLKNNKKTEKVSILKKSINEIEKNLFSLNRELSDIVNFFPNIPISDIDLKNFNYFNENIVVNEVRHNKEIKNNLTWEKILCILEMIDDKRSVSLSGSRFVIYKNFGSDLLHLLMTFMRKENKRKNYSFLDLPYLVKGEMLYNTGQLPKFREDIYKIENHNLYLIPTSEVTLINFYNNEIIDEKLLPIKLSSYSPCFRLEAGKSGKENKGLIRLHQFHKVELVKIVKHEESYYELKKMLHDSCDILEKLKIDYRILDLSYKELGISSIKTYDIEIWLPNSNKWIEISSCSNCTSFQSVRGKIRVKCNNNLKRKYHPSILNGSSLAIDRLIMAICEYYYDSEKKEIKLPPFLEKDLF